MSLIVQQVLAIFLLGSMDCSEPVCSPYDYEEKLLAKTIRLENIVDNLIQQKVDMETKFQSELDKMATEIEKINTKIDNSSKKTDNQAVTCPSTYMFNEELNLCWRLEKFRKLHWFDARKACTEEGAQLMILNDTSAISLLKEYLRAEGAVNVFVAASDIAEEGTYKWINGEPVQQIPWGSSQPSQNRAENCLVMHDGWGFNFGDDFCYGKYQFLCQMTL